MYLGLDARSGSLPAACTAVLLLLGPAACFTPVEGRFTIRDDEVLVRDQDRLAVIESCGDPFAEVSDAWVEDVSSLGFTLAVPLPCDIDDDPAGGERVSCDLSNHEFTCTQVDETEICGDSGDPLTVSTGVAIRGTWSGRRAFSAEWSVWRTEFEDGDTACPDAEYDEWAAVYLLHGTLAE